MTNKINGRTPEEIKKGLECCFPSEDPDCFECPYRAVENCFSARINDILAYIQQLERERDAAVKDMVELMQLGKFCCYCKHLTEDGECTKDLNGIDTEMLGKPGGWWCWEWRGAQEVE